VRAHATLLTGALVVAALAILFIRIAGREWRYNGLAWRRDASLATILAVVAVASAVAWPKAVTHFWAKTSFALGPAQGATFVEVAQPGWGWWLAVIGTLALALCARQARKATPKASYRK
jgi:amino acid transporter